MTAPGNVKVGLHKWGDIFRCLREPPHPTFLPFYALTFLLSAPKEGLYTAPHHSGPCETFRQLTAHLLGRAVSFF